eukprot:GHVO01026984.1.p1 GENE.GHVO01026984.1~~GHVO01026984.1.p1  ORF type:complete len:297 (+),score=60.94 GHVO01026984.1:48-893(+)
MQQNRSGSVASGMDGNIQSQRVISSNILSEVGGKVPEDTIKYIDVPVIEEVIRHVPRREVVEVEKRVPKIEYQWVERVVEVPQIQFVEKTVEVPQIQEVIKHVAVKQTVDILKEVVKYVPKVEVKIIEQTVEVPGEVIEVPKLTLVENKVVVPRYVDKEIPTVVAQRLLPIISESNEEFIDVQLKQYEPFMVPVDVYIPRAVERSLIATSKKDTHNVVSVPPAQYNSLTRSLNSGLSDRDLEGIFIKAVDGSVPVLTGIGTHIVAPLSDEWKMPSSVTTVQ